MTGILRWSAGLIVVLMAVLSQSAGTLLTAPAPQSNVPLWRKAATQDGELSVEMPVLLPIYITNKPVSWSLGERISERRVVAGYEGGAAFVVKMYETSNPEKALKGYLAYYYKAAQLTDMGLTGISGKEYVRNENGTYQFIKFIITKRRFYEIMAASHRSSHPSVDRFFNSLTINGVKFGVSPSPETNPPPMAGTSAAPPEHVYTEAEVTKPAVILFTPIPSFTGAAKQSMVSGTLVVGVVLTTSGHVGDIKVVKGLGKGLDEQATAVANLIRFLPAEKDGQIVSQYAEVKYRFESMRSSGGPH